MLLVHFKHPLHGSQTIKCARLEAQEDYLMALNIHGVCFITITASSIISIEVDKED